MSLIDDLLEQLLGLVEQYILTPTPLLKIEIEALKVTIEALLPLGSTIKVGLDLINFALDLPSPQDVELLQIIVIIWEILITPPIIPPAVEYPYENTKEQYEALNSAYIGNHQYSLDKSIERAERLSIIKAMTCHKED